MSSEFSAVAERKEGEGQSRLAAQPLGQCIIACLTQ